MLNFQFFWNSTPCSGFFLPLIPTADKSLSPMTLQTSWMLQTSLAFSSVPPKPQHPVTRFAPLLSTTNEILRLKPALIPAQTMCRKCDGLQGQLLCWLPQDSRCAEALGMQSGRRLMSQSCWGSKCTCCLCTERQRPQSWLRHVLLMTSLCCKPFKMQSVLHFCI